MTKQRQPVSGHGWLHNKVYRFLWRAGLVWSPTTGWASTDESPPIARLVGKLARKFNL